MTSALVVFLLMALETTEPTPPSEYTKEQLIAGIEHRLSLMTSMRVRYTTDTAPAPGTHLGNQIPHSDLTVVRSGSKFLVDVTFAPRFGGRYVRATTPRVSQTHNVAAGKVTLKEGEDHEVYRFDAMSSLMGIPLSEEDKVWTPRPNEDLPLTELKGLLPATLRDDRYVVLPNQERVDGIWCHVVKSVTAQTIWYKYWIDPHRDFSVLRREMITGDSLALSRVDFRHWKKCGATWYPTQAVQEDFKLNPEILTTSLVSSTHYEVKDVQIGDIAPGQAEIAIVPGMLVEDLINHQTRMISGKPDQRFLQTLEAARAEMGEHFKQAPDFQPPTPGLASRTTQILFVANIALAFFVFGIWIFRRALEKRRAA